MEKIKSNQSRINSYLNSGERVQKSIFGTFSLASEQMTPSQKGILCATNERLFFIGEEEQQSISVIDYYKIEAVNELAQDVAEISFYYDGKQHTMSFIEEGDLSSFNHFVLDRMEIKS